MRILLVAHGFPPAAAGGAEIYARALAHELAREDEVVVVAREARPDLPEFSRREHAGEPFRLLLVNYTYRESRTFRDTYRDPRMGELLAGIVDEIRPDVAHLHHLTNLTTDLVELLAIRGVPIVYTLHDYWLLCQRGQLLDLEYRRCAGPSPAGCARCLGLAAQGGAPLYAARRALGRLPAALAEPLARLAQRSARGLGGGTGEVEERLDQLRAVSQRVSLFLAPSRTLRDRFIMSGVPPGRISLHRYGHEHSPFRIEHRAPSPPLRIGFVGSVMVSKAPHLVLEAFAGLPAGAATLRLFGQYSDYHGDDSYRRILDRLLDQPGVSWRGALDHSEIPAALAELDVLVVPSIWLENAPLTISEAFLAGVPVVCSDLGGMAEMVEDGVSGLRFQPGDVADLREKLLRLVREPGLLETLRRGIPAVRPIEDDARELRAHFAQLARRAQPPRIAAVIVNHETADLTLRAAHAVLESRRPPDQLIVVDNGSRDGSAEAIERALPEARVLSSERNLGFAGGANLGLRTALADGAELLLLVNSDARIDPDCVARLERVLEGDTAVAIAGPAILAAGDPERIESLGLAFSTASGRFRELGSGADASSCGAQRSVDALSACTMLIRRSALEKIGLFDEGYFFGFEDVDLCLRARNAGFRCELVPEARVWHDGHATIGRRSPERLYYAARNHLRLVRGQGMATGTVALLNLAHALRGREVARLAGLRAVIRGLADGARGRTGPAPPGLARRG
jgi:GT2 family glycosyltransferase/glycosyltransferase involved in cell wall biosynthesis